MGTKPRRQFEMPDWDNPRIDKDLRNCVNGGMHTRTIAARHGVAENTMTRVLKDKGYRVPKPRTDPQPATEMTAR